MGMNAGWAAFFGSLRDDIHKDMEYARMQGHQQFMNELKRLDSPSGYVTQDGRPLSNREYDQLDESDRTQVQSAATANFNRSIELAKEQAKINESSLLTQEGIKRQFREQDLEFARQQTRAQEAAKREFRDKDLEFDVSRAKAVKGAEFELEDERLNTLKNKNTQKYEEFRSSPAYSKLPSNLQQSLDLMGSFGMDFEKVGSVVLKSLTTKAKEPKFSAEAFNGVGKSLMMNKNFQEKMINKPDEAMSIWNGMYNIAMGNQGSPNGDMRTKLLLETLSDLGNSTPEERNKKLKIIKSQRKGLYDELQKYNMSVEEESRDLKTSFGKKDSNGFLSKLWNFFSGETAANIAKSATGRPVWSPTPAASSQEKPTTPFVSKDTRRFREAGSLLDSLSQ